MPEIVYGQMCSNGDLQATIKTLGNPGNTFMVVLCYDRPVFKPFNDGVCAGLVSESLAGWVFSENQELKWRRVGASDFAVAWCGSAEVLIPLGEGKPLQLPASHDDYPALLWGQPVDGDAARRWEARVPRVFDFSFLKTAEVLGRLTVTVREYLSEDGSTCYWRLAGVVPPAAPSPKGG